MQMFITVAPYQPQHLVRGYCFPYRICNHPDWSNVWGPANPIALTSDIKAVRDIFGLKAKLYRLAEGIIKQKLPIHEIRVGYPLCDTLEVTMESAGTDWQKFESLLSSSFGLPIKL